MDPANYLEAFTLSIDLCAFSSVFRQVFGMGCYQPRFDIRWGSVMKLKNLFNKHPTENCNSNHIHSIISQDPLSIMISNYSLPTCQMKISLRFQPITCRTNKRDSKASWVYILGCYEKKKRKCKRDSSRWISMRSEYQHQLH